MAADMNDARSESEKAEARGSYVDEIMKREAEEAAARPPPTRSRSWVPILGPLLAIFAGLVGWNVYRAVREVEVFPPAQEQAADLFTIYLIQQSIQSYHDSTGELPPNLAVLGADDEGVEYTVRDTAYMLTIATDSMPVSYRSGEDVSPFEAAYEQLTQGQNQ